MLINGVEYSYSDIQFSFLGNFNVPGVTEINFESNQVKTNVLGAGTEPVARTRGSKSYDNSTITLHLKEIFRLIEANGFRSLESIPMFNLTLSFANGVDPIKTVTLPNCEFTKTGAGAATGDTSIATQIPIIHSAPIYQ